MVEANSDQTKSQPKAQNDDDEYGVEVQASEESKVEWGS